MPYVKPCLIPPPQVDTYTYRRARIKIRTDVVGTWRWRAFSSLIIPTLPIISTSKLVYLSASPPFIDLLTFEDISPLLRPKSRKIQTYSRPVDMQRRSRKRRPGSLDRSTSEGDQKKGGNRPEPGKPTKPETKNPKPEREGNKGKRKEKSPRTEEPVS